MIPSTFVDFKILGPLTVVDDDVELPIPGLKLRTLLALLLVRPGETVTAERLADDLWGDAIPAGAANALQSLVSKLRRTLGESGRLLVTTPDGYRLDVAPLEIDAGRFADRALCGRHALAGGDAAQAAETLRPALALWNGNALEGLRDEGVLNCEATRLDELRMNALEDRLEADLRLGRHAEVIAELGALTAAHPMRERLHGFLMLALYRAGRQAEALSAFRQARHVLLEELGLDPGPELRALESAILDHDPSLDLDLPAASLLKRHHTNVTKGLSSFIGRIDDVASLTAVVAANRLITVIGPGGAGKTRLAVEVAAANVGPMDVWFVDLAPLTSADAVADTIASAVGAADGALMAQGTPRLGVDRIAEHLADQDALVVLDNCEHVIPEAARIAERLLMSCPGLTIVATSREALGVRGETIWAVPPMTVDDAVALFADRAAATSGFSIGEHAQTVTELCHRLDGMPLAIELAAGRVRAIPVHQLASRLDDRFRLLTGGARTALPRQQTLRAVVEWSYDLLFDDEQRVFARLSVFAGGCSLEAAEAVCGGDDIASEDVADLLGHLVDKSLVIADHSGREVRYRLLQTLALYARERLVASDDADRFRARHADYFAELCHRGHAAFHGVDQKAWLTAVELDADNLRTCLTWRIEQGHALIAQTMLGPLGWCWWFAGRADEGWRLLTASLRCPGETTPIVRAWAAMWACYVGACAGAGLDDASKYGEEAVQLLRASPGQSIRDVTTEMLLPDGLTLLAATYGMMGRHDEAQPLYEQARLLYEQGDDPWSKAMAMNNAGQEAEHRGDIQLAYDMQHASIEWFDAARVEWALAIINGDCGVLAARLGLVEAASEHNQAARRAAQYLRLGGYEAVLLSRLGSLALEAGDVDRADLLMTEALDLAEHVRFSNAEAFAHSGRAMVRRVQGRYDEAEQSANRAVALFLTTGLPHGHTQALSTLGFIAQHRGDAVTARRMHVEAMELARRTTTLRAVALALDGLAGVATLERDGVRAATLLGAAQTIRDADGGAPPGADSDAPGIRRSAIELIGHEAFDAALAAGAAASLDRVLLEPTSAG